MERETSVLKEVAGVIVDRGCFPYCLSFLDSHISGHDVAKSKNGIGVELIAPDRTEAGSNGICVPAVRAPSGSGIDETGFGVATFITIYTSEKRTVQD